MAVTNACAGEYIIPDFQFILACDNLLARWKWEKMWQW